MRKLQKTKMSYFSLLLAVFQGGGVKQTTSSPLGPTFRKIKLVSFFCFEKSCCNVQLNSAHLL